MAGESWKSHKNTALERDMSADHDAQMDQWLSEQLAPDPAEVARSNDANLDKVDRGFRTRQSRPGTGGANDTDANRATLRMRGRAAADMPDKPGEIAARQIAGELTEAPAQTTRDAAIHVREPATPATPQDDVKYQQAQQPTVAYVPPPMDPQYRPDADYPSVVLANTRVAPAETVDPWAPRPVAEHARFQTELAIAQQVAGNQVRAQQQAADAERSASAAVGQDIAPASIAPARTPHR